ncbi:MAG: hypothetical protein ABI905_01905 [Betaproteobacteria bacterium]
MKQVQSHPDAVRDALEKSATGKARLRESAKRPLFLTNPREGIKRYIVQRFYTRFHMSLILASSGFACMLGNWALLRADVHAMWVRYPIAISLAYLTFMAGVWLWLKYVGNTCADGKKQSFVDGGNIVNGDLVPNFGGGGGGSVEIPDALRVGGGSFDGGGAGGGWTEANPVQAFAGNGSPPAPSGSGFFGDAAKGIGDKLGGFCDLDGEGIVLIVLALLLIFSVLLLSGYIIWFAPDILSEAVFGATLAGTLARTAKNNDEAGWVLGVVKKTWWPFAIVFVVAMVFAVYAAINYPQASTFGSALAAAVAG